MECTNVEAFELSDEYLYMGQTFARLLEHLMEKIHAVGVILLRLLWESAVKFQRQATCRIHYVGIMYIL